MLLSDSQPWVILSVWYAAEMAWNLLPDGCWTRTSGDKNCCTCSCVPAKGWVVYFQGLGAALPDLTQISARHRSTGARSTGLLLGWNFPAQKKKKKCRKRTASYDLILLKIPGYVSTSLLVPDFFLLTLRLNSDSLKGNKCQLHKEVVLIFFPEYFELHSQSILLN